MSKRDYAREVPLMSLNRLEAFSDGVFAIAATLLIIEVPHPELVGTTPAEATDRLLAIWPQVLSYVTSFSVIGVIWLNHHALFRLLRRVDRGVSIINLALLLCVAFIPYATAVMAASRHLPPVVAFFGLTLAASGLAYNILWFYVVRQDRRGEAGERTLHRVDVRAASLWSIGYPLANLAAAALSAVSSGLSIALYLLISLFYLLPGVIDRELHRRADARSLEAAPTD